MRDVDIEQDRIDRELVFGKPEPKTVEVMTVQGFRDSGAGWGPMTSLIDLIPDPSVGCGERMMLGRRVMVNPDDFAKLKKMHRSRSVIRFIARLREKVKNRPAVKPNIVRKGSEVV